MFEDIFGKKWPIQCMGCAITNGEMDLPGGIIYETENFILHQDPANPIPGFLIIALKKHACSFTEFTLDEINDFSKLLHKARIALDYLQFGLNNCKKRLT